MGKERLSLSQINTGNNSRNSTGTGGSSLSEGLLYDERFPKYL